MKRPPAHSAEPLSRFLDEYLAYLYESCPTEAAADGVHLHDDLLEDFSRAAIDARIRELGGWMRRLDGITGATLTTGEKLDRQRLGDCIRARLFDLEEVAAWRSSPRHYAEILARSLAGQLLFDHAPVEDRARRVVSKLRQTPRLMEAAQVNVTDPPGLFVRAGLESCAGVITFIERDLPRAFRDLEDMHLLGDLADASTVALDALRAYEEHLRGNGARRSRASFRLGAERFMQKLRLEDGIDLPLERLLEIAQRELAATQDEFRKVASSLNGDWSAAWREVQSGHPAAGELLAVVGRQVAELATFVERKRIVSLPAHEPLRVAPTPEFYRWTFASLSTAGPFEAKALPAWYYITNIDPAWPAARQQQHLRGFNEATLWAMSIHETYPGHLLQFEHLRHNVEAPLRKSTLFAPTSVVEGWAHYCEQMMLEQGFARGNAVVRLGQLAEALVRLARAVVGIRLHAEDLSVEQGVRFFREEAFVEENRARGEAERGTFDPGYVLYALGKQMLLKLRADCQAAEGKAFSLRGFHDRFLGQGLLPVWMHRRLLLGAPGALLD